jgi:murein DD-endopeptidase MepM/ murein hydrolase activator NlpD
MLHIKKYLLGLIAALVVFAPATASAADVSAQRRNIEQAPMYDENAETVACVAAGQTAGGTAIFTGSNNQQIAYNFFVSQGFSPQQSAGIVGNLIAESGVNPKRVQSTKTPDGDKDTITVDNKTGYGIAQWTSSGRQQGLVKLSQDRGMSIQGDLPLQLDYLMQEFNVSYPNILRDIRSAPGLYEASSIFMTKFERPKDQSSEAQRKRGDMGQKVLDLYAGAASVGNLSTTDPSVAPNSSPVVAPDPSCVEGGVAGPDTPNSGVTAFVGFPLQTTKARMTELNGGQFKDGVMGQSGHPYAAHDIMADSGSPVMSILAGKVVGVSSDKCGGRLLAIYNQELGVTVAYLHLSTSITPATQGATLGSTVVAGQVVGYVGTAGNGCGSAHLHIDANTTNRRIGCKRESCSAENKALFQAGSNKIGLAKGLYDSYMKLP